MQQITMMLMLFILTTCTQPIVPNGCHKAIHMVIEGKGACVLQTI